ncbi:polysaccharide pyruvyl transferase [Geobacter sp. OR-1]|uniref:polysaccharide pyruvyl transferase family protein n=1 Tax=Geobacter sp. OR-1 TaxID=1266765 RepID=UPI00054327A0|nr:polysaccharide pyruvyl transferase family protein [Geobacter sp. OR-1]GAM08928.1 polysaccharide pyruvyl transferase [Geobacter sp. OR-1]
MNVWHVYARYYNFGDYALGVGVRNLFLKYYNSEILFKLKDVHSLVFDENTVDQLNSSADMLLVGGGGLIHGFAGDKWMLKIPDRLIPKIRVPLIIYGVGYNQFRGEGDIHPRIVENIRRLQEHCLSFSVRNDGSREELLKLGVDLPEVPDPGFFVDGDYARPPIEGDFVIIQLANDMKHARGFDDESLLSHLSDICRYLLGKGYKIVLCPHVRTDDILGRQLIANMGNPEGLTSWEWFDIIRDECTLKGLSYYKHAKMVIGMRGHAQICPAGMLTPVITLGNHRKHLDLIKKQNLPDHYVEVGDPQLSDKVIMMFNDILANYQSIKDSYGNSLAHLLETSSLFIRNLAEISGKNNLP